MGQMAGRFLDVFLDQTNSCNLKCTFCGMSDPRMSNVHRHDMPLWLFERIARQVFPHARYVALSCTTEPLIVADLGKRLEILDSHSVPFSELTTNGMLLNEPLCNQMIKTSLSRIAVSIDSPHPEIHEQMRPGASLPRILSNIKTLNACKKRSQSSHPTLRLNHVLTAANVDGFDGLLDLAESLSVTEIDVLNHVPIRGSIDENCEDRRYWKMVRKCQRLLMEWSRRTGIEIVGFLRGHPDEIKFDGLGHRLLCRRPWNSVAIPFNGDVQPCMTWMRAPIGNLGRQGFSDIWNGPAASALRREFIERQAGADCRHCSIKMARSNQIEDGYFMTLTRPPAARSEPC